MGTVPTYRTWTAGEIVTAAEFNANVRDAGNFLVGLPVAELRATAAQSLANATFVGVLFDTEDLDSDGGHSTTTNTSRYTAQTPGWYHFGGGYCIAGTTGRRLAAWGKNGSIVNGTECSIVSSAAGAVLGIAARPRQMQMNGSTDYVELYAYQENGGALSTSGTTFEQPTMSVAWVHS